MLVCALGFERRAVPAAPNGGDAWSDVVTDALGVPALPSLATNGALGGRVRLSANFRDQYYALVPAVADHAIGPPLVTSGLIDPGRSRWGERPITFARHRHARPRVDLSALPAWMQRWSADLLVPKVLIANQTRVIEAVADPAGAWLPGVPVLTARPTNAADVWPVAAVLTSPVASAWAWHRAAGTGLSAETLRLGPRWLAELPWPRGPLGRRSKRCRLVTSSAAGGRSSRPMASTERRRSPTGGRAQLPGRLTSQRGDPLPDCTARDASPPATIRSPRLGVVTLRPRGARRGGCGGGVSGGGSGAEAAADEGRQIAARVRLRRLPRCQRRGRCRARVGRPARQSGPAQQRHDGGGRRGLPDPVDQGPGGPDRRRCLRRHAGEPALGRGHRQDRRLHLIAGRRWRLDRRRRRRRPDGAADPGGHAGTERDRAGG